MPAPDSIYISAVVEGTLDLAVAERLITRVGARIGRVHGRKGKAWLLGRINGFNEAARLAPWLVLVDLDQDEHCAPQARNDWLPAPSEQMCFRIVIREIESWLMADRTSLASFLRVPPSALPVDPEVVANPKEHLVRIARRSRSRDIRSDLVPRDTSGRSTGSAYDARLTEFVRAFWNPGVAAASSDSLRRAIAALEYLVAHRPR